MALGARAMEGGWGVEAFGEAARDTHTFARRVGRLPEQRQGDAIDYRSLLHRDGSVLSALTLQARAASARCWAAISHVLLLVQVLSHAAVRGSLQTLAAAYIEAGAGCSVPRMFRVLFISFEVSLFSAAERPAPACLRGIQRAQCLSKVKCFATSGVKSAALQNRTWSSRRRHTARWAPRWS